MKILMFNYEYPPVGGGGGVINQQIAEQLARRHRVTVVTSEYKGLPRHEEVGGVQVHRVHVIGRNSKSAASLISMLSYFPASIKTGQEVIDHVRPDIINSHFAIPTGPSAVVLARRNRIPHALCIHGGDIFDPSKRLSPHRTPGLHHTVRWVLRSVDRILAGSHNIAHNARSIYGVTNEISIVPYGLKRPEVKSVVRSCLGLGDDQIVLATVGRLVSRKAHQQLVEILARLKDDRVVLVIIGDGPERLYLNEVARRHQVSDRVRMTGFVSEQRKYELLQAADIFVSTTQHEGFGLMYLEAMFCGLPIVTYDHGGHTDFLVDGKTGFLAALNDQSAFQRDLLRLIQQPVLRQAMGRYNQCLSEKHTIEHCASQYESLFEEMLCPSQQPSAQTSIPAEIT